MSPIERRHWSVPRTDRTAYIEPEPAAQPDLVQRNRALLDSYGFDLAGRPFRKFRAEARAEAVTLARAYTARLDVPVPAWSEPQPLVLVGHQPPPYHPGVWIKNFLAGALAEASGGAAVNLNVDNDEAHAQAFRLPTRDLTCRMGGDEVREARIEFAPHAGGVPFEEQSPEALRAEAVHNALEAAPSAEIAQALRRCWMRLVEAVPRARCLGEAFIAARRNLEEDVGLGNLELGVSDLADGDSFRRFVAAMLADRERLFEAYNGALAEYRDVYDEENAAQPLPDLVREEGRMEMPWWVWRAGGRRERLWVRPMEAGSLVLECDHTVVGRVTVEQLADPEAGAAALGDLRRAGWKIRPRALSMTLFCRLLLGDVFIHGLGGALYDQVTDAMIERLFGVEPPSLVLASCTVHLPLETYPSTEADLRQARRAVRDWRYNPDRVMDEAHRTAPEVERLVEEKWQCIRRNDANPRPPARERRRLWQRIREINGRLAMLAPGEADAARHRIKRVRRELDYNAILTGREYPFCLYPTDLLVEFYREAVRMPAKACKEGQASPGI